MYHTQIKNQALNTTFSHKDSHTDNYTKYTCDILNLLIQHNGKKLSRSFIANRIGCSIKTVSRSTTQLHKDGLITKHQQNKYDANHYVFNNRPSKPTFNHWLNSLSPKNQELYISNGIRIDHKNKIIHSYKNVPPKSKKESLILDKYLFRNTITKTIPSLHARMRVGSSMWFSDSNKQKKERDVMNDFQKQWILDHKTDPRVKDMINNPRIKAALINPTIEKLTQLLDLTQKEQLNLIAFDENALQYAYDRLELIVNGKKVLKEPVLDKMAWLVGTAKAYCKLNDITPDWQWYKDVCAIIGIDSINNDPKPLIVKVLPKKESYKGEYGNYKQMPSQPKALSPEEQLRRWKVELTQREDRASFYGNSSPHDKKVIAKLKQQIEDGEEQITKLSPWEQMQRILPLEDRVEKWRSEVVKLESQLAAFPAADPFNLKGLLMRTIENAKHELKESEQRAMESILSKRSSNAKQELLCEDDSNIMAENSTEQQQVLRSTDNQQSLFWSAFESTA